ncbi:MAG: WYL domain-containing protein [Gammaproteobacteria bacterium]|nr:WYL domain-containing protein [Gammaproteobacteria bacterium]
MPAKTIKTLTRTLAMLKCIPIYPKSLTTRQIHEHVKAFEPNISLRTIQRDLMELTDVIGLTFDDDSKSEGYGWSFAFDSPNQFIPSISKEEALSLKLVQEHLKLYLPSHTYERLTALFKKSDNVLQNSSETKDWSSLVQPMPQALSFTPTDVNQEHIDAIYNGLMNESWLHIQYGNKDKTYKVKPLGVIIRDSKLVMVCQYDGFDNVRNLLVHRLKSVEVLDQTFQSDFSLKDYIAKQAAAVLLNKDNIELTFEAKGYVKNLLNESELNETQKVSQLSEDWVLVKVSVPHTVELENWLLSQLHDIRLLGPESLKARVINKAKAAFVLNNI